MRALIVVLWPDGLRIQEALALTETDLDKRRGSVLVRAGKNDKRREVGMDAWAWSALAPWTRDRAELPVGPLFCVIDGPTRGRAWSASAVRVEGQNSADEKSALVVLLKSKRETQVLCICSAEQKPGRTSNLGRATPQVLRRLALNALTERSKDLDVCNS